MDAPAQTNTRRACSDVRELRRVGFALIDALVEAFPIEPHARQVLADAREGADGRDISRALDREWTAAIDGASFMHDGDRARVRTFANRFWIDLSITHRDVIIPVNFKAGRGAGADNVGGLQMWRHLILGEALDPETHALAGPAITEARLAKRAGDLFRGRVRASACAREYFCLHYNTDSAQVSTLALTDLPAGELRVNPKKGAQVRMRDHPRVGRDNDQSLRFVLGCYRDYLMKMAEPWLAFA